MKKKSGSWVSFIIIIIFLIIIYIPVIYAILIALTPHNELFVNIIPKKFTIINFIEVLKDSIKMRTYLNSMIIALSSAAISLTFGTLAGYGLSRFNFKTKNIYIIGAIITQMLPMEVLVLSYFRIVSNLNFYNTLLALIWTHITISLPFVILMTKSIIDGIPKELEEAGMIDGCSRATILTRIVLPIGWAGFFAAFIFAFLQSWGELLYALVLTSDYRAQTANVEIAKLMGHYVTSWETMLAMTCLINLPILILFGITQKQFIKGMIAGSLKQ